MNLDELTSHLVKIDLESKRKKAARASDVDLNDILKCVSFNKHDYSNKEWIHGQTLTLYLHRPGYSYSIVVRADSLTLVDYSGIELKSFKGKNVKKFYAARSKEILDAIEENNTLPF